jgi:hypothetical protein
MRAGDHVGAASELDYGQEGREGRRALIQSVKQQVVSESAMWGHGSLRAQILQDIERALAALPVNELPREELVDIARARRDEICSRADEVDRSQRRARSEEVTRKLELDNRRRYLISKGNDYAKRELREVDGLDAFERWRIERRIDEELASLHGDETQSDVEDLVEEIFEREGIEPNDDDEEQPE